MRRNLAGGFRARQQGEGAWRLSRSEPKPLEVFVRGADPEAAGCFQSPSIHDIGLEWRPDGVLMTMVSNGRPNSVRTQSAIVHEPLPLLYAALPLASLDDKARRFWRRVFRLVRIPGGRHLLGALASRSRGRL